MLLNLWGRWQWTSRILSHLDGDLQFMIRKAPDEWLCTNAPFKPEDELASPRILFSQTKEESGDSRNRVLRLG